MELYKRMYAILCTGASKALDALPHLPENIYSRCLLEMALAEAEELFLAEDDVSDIRPDNANFR